MQRATVEESPFRSRIGDRRFRPIGAQSEALARICFTVEHHRRGALLVGEAGTGRSVLIDAAAARLQSPLRRWLRLDLFEPAASNPFIPIAVPTAPTSDRRTAFASWERWDDWLTGLCAMRQQLVIVADPIEQLTAAAVTLMKRLLAQSARAGGAATLVGTLEQSHQAPQSLLDLFDLPVPVELWTFEESLEYVRSALQSVGVDASHWSESAVECLHSASAGRPRKLISLCDHVWWAGALEQPPLVSAEFVTDVLAEFVPHRPQARSAA